MGNRFGGTLLSALIAASFFLSAAPAAAAASPKAKAYREAKKKCLKENSLLRGKALQKCISKKLK